MQWFQITAGLLSSLAWPLLVLVVLLRFKGPIDAALTGLSRGRPVKRVKAGGVEVEWDDLESSEQDMADMSASAHKDRQTDDLVGDLYELARSFPSAAILLAFKRVEAKLSSTAAQYWGHPLRKPARVLQLTEALGDWLPDEVRTATHSLRRVRNQVSHLEDESEVTPVRATQYLILASEVLAALSVDAPDGEGTTSA